MINMKKAVAIPYIIALIIGVIVVAVLGYWFISSGIIGNKIGTEAQCTARKTEYCTTQTQDACEKVKQICKGEGAMPSDWANYCQFIPNWKKSGSCP